LRGISFDLQIKTDTRIKNILQIVPYFENNELFVNIEEIAQYISDEFAISYENIEVIEIIKLVQATILRKQNQNVK
ncbi:hypothetical protein, partial [Peribacillus sp. N1]